MFEGYKSESGNKKQKCCVPRTGKQMIAECRNRCVHILIVVVNHTLEPLLFSLLLLQIDHNKLIKA
jgi:hypothetical protein